MVSCTVWGVWTWLQQKKPDSRDGRVHPYTGRLTASYVLAGKTPLWYPSPSLESGLRYYFLFSSCPLWGSSLELSISYQDKTGKTTTVGVGKMSAPKSTYLHGFPSFACTFSPSKGLFPDHMGPI